MVPSAHCQLEEAPPRARRQPWTRSRVDAAAFYGHQVVFIEPHHFGPVVTALAMLEVEMPVERGVEPARGAPEIATDVREVRIAARRLRVPRGHSARCDGNPFGRREPAP